MGRRALPSTLASAPADVSEAAFQATVLELAALRGWHAYHTHDSRRSQKGFPDLVLVRGGSLIFAELKSAKGRISAEQQGWHDALFHVAWEIGDAKLLRVAIWRPADWPEIEEALQ